MRWNDFVSGLHRLQWQGTSATEGQELIIAVVSRRVLIENDTSHDKLPNKPPKVLTKMTQGTTMLQ